MWDARRCQFNIRTQKKEDMIVLMFEKYENSRNNTKSNIYVSFYNNTTQQGEVKLQIY